MLIHDGWMTCYFTSFSIEFQSYQADRHMITKGTFLNYTKTYHDLLLMETVFALNNFTVTMIMLYLLTDTHNLYIF